MSGKPIILPGQSFQVRLSEGQQDCVDKLRAALEEAERGVVHTVGVVLCMSKGYALVMGGTDAGSLNLGLDDLKQAILRNIQKPTTKM